MSREEGCPGQVRDDELLLLLPGQVWEGEQVEGVADRQVALRWEGDDGEDARIGGAEAKGFLAVSCKKDNPPFREETSQATEDAAKGPGVLMPIQQQLIGEACNAINHQI